MIADAPTTVAMGALKAIQPLVPAPHPKPCAPHAMKQDVVGSSCPLTSIPGYKSPCLEVRMDTTWPLPDTDSPEVKSLELQRQEVAK